MPGSTTRFAIAALLLAGGLGSVAVGPRPAEEASRKVEAPPSALVLHVAHRYRIAEAAAERAVNAAYLAGYQADVDPLLVLAVIGVESSFNPVAESGAGAKGLMQIIPAYHRTRLDEFGGDEVVYDPLANIAVGTRILRDYIARTGSLQAALQSYNGAALDPEARYARKVLTERERLRHTYE